MPGTTPDLASADAPRLVGFYEQAYSRDRVWAALYGRSRALGALGKADHVLALCARAALRPGSTVQVDCGDGALLCELHRRGFGGRPRGCEITRAAAAIARERAEIEAVELYDGVHLPAASARSDLGIVSHVSRARPRPRRAARPARARLSRRGGGGAARGEPLGPTVGKARARRRGRAIHRLDCAAARLLIARAGLAVAHEIEDPLALSVHLFFATTRRGRWAARSKWALRAAPHRLAPGLARRLFTVRYARPCEPAS